MAKKWLANILDLLYIYDSSIILASDNNCEHCSFQYERHGNPSCFWTDLSVNYPISVTNGLIFTIKS